MNRGKQNNEMRYLADEMGKAISTEVRRRYLEDERKLEAVLKANGWRKVSEIIDKVLELLDENECRVGSGVYYYGSLKHDIAELKNKYTEGEE